MRTALRSMLLTATTAAAVVLSATAATATPGAVSTEGYDVSYPQCGTALPTGQAFGVVGVNGGLATTANPCLATQLTWAQQSSGAVAAQPRIQLYLNTANPGQVRDQVTTWPSSGRTPYGRCDGSNSSACSWQYGWDRAQRSVTGYFQPAATNAGVSRVAADYVWWLDVETMNTWQTGSATARAHNRATLEGMTAYLGALGARAGIYSTAVQWQQIAGAVGSGSSLRDLPSWLAGSPPRPGAQAACTRPPLVPGGSMLLAQYVSGGLDHDVSCR